MPISNSNISIVLISWIFTTDNQSRQTLLHSVVFFGWMIFATDSLDATFSVTENEPIGTRVGILTEVIETFRYKAGINFHLQQIEYQSEKPLFSVNKYSGVISTSAILDRELICPKVSGTNLPCSISLMVSVVEFLINIKINIVDVNDNAPCFRSKEFLIKIAENENINHTIELEKAIDLDSAQFGIDGYKIDLSSESPFQLVVSQSFLQLKLTKLLDYEITTRYDFNLKACDTGSFCTAQRLIVEVVDVNDVVPQFEQSNYSIVVKETLKLNSKLLTVRASDEEKGEYGKIVYRLVDTNQQVAMFLKIDSNTGDIFLIKSLIGMSKIECTIEAQDSGQSPKFTWTKLVIHVIDVNNNVPEIRINPSPDVLSKYTGESVYHIDLFENSKPGVTLAFIKVFDKDLGPNGQVHCLFKGRYTGNRNELDIIEMGSKNSRHRFYKLVPKISFDRENKTHELDYSLQCFDSGTPALSSSVDFRINILDCNEYPPYFDSQLYQASVSEESISDCVVKFTISDADATSTNLFHLNGTGSEMFHIQRLDDTHGRIVSTYPVDREKVEKINLSMFVENLGINGRNFTTMSSVLVTISDVNDNPPIITGKTNFEVMENSLTESVLGKITITDIDSGINAQFSVMVETSMCLNKDNKESNIDFEINNHGEIRSYLMLDYENIKTCFLKVIITDKGQPSLTSTSTVTLQILDENDNYPQWIFPSIQDNQLNVSVSASKSGSKLTRIRAIDFDKEARENVTYKLHNYLGTFDLDILTGELMSVTDLKPGKFVLHVSSHDQGVPSRANYSNLTILITMSSEGGSNFSSHMLLILGLIPACALIILICAVIPIIFLVKWQKRRRSHNLTSSLQTPLYQCPDINHLVRGDGQLEKDTQMKSSFLSRDNIQNDNNVLDVDLHKTYISRPPDIQTFCDNICPPNHQTDYSNFIKLPVSKANVGHDSDVCSADSGQGASVEDVAGNYIKGHYDPLKYQYKMSGYHWCPALPEDQLMECNCSTSISSHNPGKCDVIEYRPMKTTDNCDNLKERCWCPQCSQYPDGLSSDGLHVTSLNPLCQVHSNLFPIYLTDSQHHNSRSTGDQFTKPSFDNQPIIFNTQV